MRRPTKRITQRQAAQAFNLSAPLDMELRPVAKKQVRKKEDRDHTNSEWHLQAICIKNIRERQKYDKELRFMAPGAAQTYLKDEQAGYAKAQGYQKGLPDIWLLRRKPYVSPPNTASIKLHIVELKIGKNDLSDEQTDWFGWLGPVNNWECSRVDNLQEFLRILDGF